MATLQNVKNAYTLGKEESDQLKIANNRFRNWNPHGSINEDGDAYRDYKAPPKAPGELPNKYRGPVYGVEDDGQMFFDFVKQLQINPQQLANLNMWPNLEGIGVTIPKDDSEYGEASGPNKKELEEKGWSNLLQGLQINSDIAGALLPGESAGSSTGGLKGMTPDGVQRYLKENNITGPAADKIWKKYKGLQGGINLPLADASALTDLLSPHQNPRSGSLRGMPDKERIELLIKGVAAHKA